MNDILDFEEVPKDYRVQLVATRSMSMPVHGGNKINFNVRRWEYPKLLLGSS